MSQEIIRQLVNIKNSTQTSLTLTIFPVDLWEIDVLNLESLDRIAKLNLPESKAIPVEMNMSNVVMDLTIDSDDSSVYHEPDLIRIENFLNKQICVSRLSIHDFYRLYSPRFINFDFTVLY